MKEINRDHLMHPNLLDICAWVKARAWKIPVESHCRGTLDPQSQTCNFFKWNKIAEYKSIWVVAGIPQAPILTKRGSDWIDSIRTNSLHLLQTTSRAGLLELSEETHDGVPFVFYKSNRKEEKAMKTIFAQDPGCCDDGDQGGCCGGGGCC